jgi:hypothetical protein
MVSVSGRMRSPRPAANSMAVAKVGESSELQEIVINGQCSERGDLIC